jgi:hypothetical protein
MKEGGVLAVAVALAVDVDSCGIAIGAVAFAIGVDAVVAWVGAVAFAITVDVAVVAVVFAIGVDAVVAWASHTVVPIVVVVFVSKQKIKFALCYFTGFEFVLSMGWWRVRYNDTCVSVVHRHVCEYGTARCVCVCVMQVHADSLK